MSDQIYDKVACHPKFRELVTKRSSFALKLSIIVLVVYYAFVVLATMAPDLFSSPLTENLTWPLGLVIGFGIQIFAFLMTGVYVYRANGEFDTLNRAIIEESSR